MPPPVYCLLDKREGAVYVFQRDKQLTVISALVEGNSIRSVWKRALRR